MKKYRFLWIAGIVLVMAFTQVRLAQAQIGTVASSPAWGGQHVCLNAASPVACPAGATQYGYPFPGWFAPRPPGANWIWKRGVTGETPGADLATAFFSNTVSGPASGLICLAADDFAELKVNGAVVGTVGSTTNAVLAGLAQSLATCFNVTLQSVTNLIEVKGQDGPKSFSPFALTGCNPSCKYNENPAGVMFFGALRCPEGARCAAREGRLTGGGSTTGAFDAAGRTLPVLVDIHQGLQLHCDKTQLPNNLEVNWDGGNHFHLDTLDSATCFDDPAKMPNPPPAGFDSYTGRGTGSCNGAPGATAEWYFTDEGEPGTSDDVVALTITCADGSVLTAGGVDNLQGNFQAHAQ